MYTALLRIDSHLRIHIRDITQVEVSSSAAKSFSKSDGDADKVCA